MDLHPLSALKGRFITHTWSYDSYIMTLFDET